MIVPPDGIPVGGMFFIRWLPTNITGDDDGLAIDDFKLSLRPTADFDEDGAVDGSDFLTWQRWLGRVSSGMIEFGDANQDGEVDATDLAIWRGQFGPRAAARATGESVPEPLSALLLTLVLAAKSLPRGRRG